jgi:photosystem II stability/assembly factor-like uncharacterized protein
MRITTWVMAFSRFSVAAVLILASSTAFAGDNVWTSNGPAADITALAVDSASIYAGAYLDGRGVGFRSIDGGASWTEIFEVPFGWSISAFSLDLANPSDVFAAANSRPFNSTVYRSEDGSHWAEVASLKGNVFDLVARPHPPGMLYAGFSSCFCVFSCFLTLTCSSEVRTSADFGVTWVRAGTGLAGSAIRTLALDADDRNRVYAAGDAGVFVSTDSGDRWSAANAGPQCYSVLALALRPPDGALFAGTALIFADRFGCGGVFRSDDGGQSWRNMGLSQHYVTSLAIDPTNPQTIYAGAARIGFFSPDGGVFRSLDGGNTWTFFGTGLPAGGVNQLVIDPSGRSLHASTSEGVFDYEIVPGARPPIVVPRSRQTRTIPARP